MHAGRITIWTWCVLAVGLAASTPAWAQQFGACCGPNGGCLETTAQECAAAGGVAFYPNTPCSEAPCHLATSACCLPNGSCAMLSSQECEQAGGQFHPGSGCATITCAPREACCLPDGSCTMLTGQDCQAAGGLPIPGFDCSQVTCQQPLEACCLPNGQCVMTTSEKCISGGGLPQGVGSDCSTVTCPQPLEACCLPSGECVMATKDQCVAGGGLPQGPGSDCLTVSCVPKVACCLADGTCTDLPVDECIAIGGHPRPAGSSCDHLQVPCLKCDWNPDMPAKWIQLPDTKPTGIDIRVDNPTGTGPGVVLADDWLCRERGTITDVHLWGSWKEDRKGQIQWINVTIWSDQPVVPGGPGYSMPSQLLWQATFGPDEFTEKLFTTVTPGEWWWDPRNQELVPNGDTQIWQVNICIDPAKHDLFKQEGTTAQPIVYWLGIEVRTDPDSRFGWKTRDPSQHFNDNAVIAIGGAPPWADLHYPFPHPLYNQTRLDLAFALTGEAERERDWGDAPDSPLLASYPTLAGNMGANHIISPNIFLGALIDAEPDGQPNVAATGDDLAASDDEDGVVFLNSVARGRWTKLAVTASAPGFLNAWLDFNRDGDWADAGEQIFTNTPVIAGVNNLSFKSPWWASLGISYARFRYNTAGGLSYTGPAPDGEVEDYQVRIRPAKIIAHHIFYNASAWDGNDIAPNPSDDQAIAPDKVALMPGGMATFRNYISYNKSINGIMIDVEDLPEGPLAAGDLIFTNTGRDFTSNLGLAAASVTVRPGEGDGGSDRITVTFANNQLPNSSWLRVQMIASATTGLEADDVHYWGVAFGESGNSPLNAIVNATDQNAAKNNPVGFPAIAALTNPHDYNRDKRVNATDQNVAKNNATSFLTALQLLIAP